MLIVIQFWFDLPKLVHSQFAFINMLKRDMIWDNLLDYRYIDFLFEF